MPTEKNMKKSQQPLMRTAMSPTLKPWCMWNERYAGQASFSSCLTTSVEEEILRVQPEGFLIISFNVFA